MKVFILKNEAEKNQGLQGVRYMPPETFLVFLNIRPGEYFHTKNCLFPIDIISVDQRGRILKHWSCKPELPSIGPMPPGTVAVVETHAGWCRARSMGPGSNIYRLLSLH